MATIDWLTGIYLTTNQVLKYPDYVERLRNMAWMRWTLPIFAIRWEAFH